MNKHYCIEPSRIQALSEKADELMLWLAKNAPFCEASQKHLDQGTKEQAYWHYGYVCALRDVLAKADCDPTRSPSAKP